MGSPMTQKDGSHLELTSMQPSSRSRTETQAAIDLLMLRWNHGPKLPETAISNAGLQISSIDLGHGFALKRDLPSVDFYLPRTESQDTVLCSLSDPTPHCLSSTPCCLPEVGRGIVEAVPWVPH